jgi:sterol desaturase/sphingolipid hydroxylase (fatty acid hydroxylase superfamily)
MVKMNVEKEIKELKNRNVRVEKDEAWEVSKTRKIVIAILTYLTIVLFFMAMNLPSPFVNAIVPTIGFLLSTLALPFIKNFWVKKVFEK